MKSGDVKFATDKGYKFITVTCIFIFQSNVPSLRFLVSPLHTWILKKKAASSFYPNKEEIESDNRGLQKFLLHMFFYQIYSILRNHENSKYPGFRYKTQK